MSLTEPRLPTRAGAHAKIRSHSKQQARRRVSSVSPAAADEVSPKARRLAKELGVDVTARARHRCGWGSPCPPTWVCGAELEVRRTRAASDSASMQESPATSKWRLHVGRLMAERTTQSWTTVPPFLCHPRCRCERVEQLPRAGTPGDGTPRCCPSDAYGSAGTFGRSRRY